MFNPVPKPKRVRRKKDRGNPSQARKEVIAIDGEFCVFCGTPFNLELHRITYASQSGKYELDNCVLLCTKHHQLVHSNKNKYMPMLQKHVAERS